MNLFKNTVDFISNALKSFNFRNNEIKKQDLIQIESKDTKEKQGIEYASNQLFNQNYHTLDEGLFGYASRGEVLNKEGFAEAERVFRDPQVKACIHTLIFSILKKPFIIESSDNSKDALFAKDFIDHVFKELKGNIQKSFYPLVASGILYGYGLSEKVYKTSNDSRFEGFLILDKIKNKKPGLFSFELDEFDNILAIKALGTFTENTSYLPVDKFLIYTFLSLFENPHGQATFDSLYKFVYSKSQLIQQMLIANTKFASDTVGVEIPVDQINDEESIQAAQNIAEAVQAGNAIAYQAGLNIKTFGGAKGPCPYLPRLHYLDSQISLAILGNDLTNKASTSGGTHAETKEKAKVTSIFSDFIQTDIEEMINENIIRDLLEWNSNINSSLFPKFKFLDNNKDKLKEKTDSIKNLVDIKVLRPETRVNDEIFIRQECEVPSISDDEIEKRQNFENMNIDIQRKIFAGKN